MPDLSGSDLLREWRKALDAVTSAVGSVAGRAELPEQLQSAMQRQLELVGELIERERRLQAEIAEQLIAPVDSVFALLEQSGATLQRQADALDAAGRAIEETAALMRSQAEIFERTVGTMRRPAEMARSAAGIERRPPAG